MIALALLIAALVVFVLAALGALTLGKLLAIGLALTVAALIAERLEGSRPIRRVVR